MKNPLNAMTIHLELLKQKQQELQVTIDGQKRTLDRARLTYLIEASCTGLPAADPQAILRSTLPDLYDSVPMEEVRKAVVLAARTMIEKDPAYSYVTARLLLDSDSAAPKRDWPEFQDSQSTLLGVFSRGARRWDGHCGDGSGRA